MKNLFLLLLTLLFCAAPVFAADTAKTVLKYGDTIDVEPPPAAFVRSGNTLFMTFCGSQRIVAAFDISKPAAPRLLSTFRTGFFPQSLALAPDGKTLLVADGAAVSTLNVSDPAKISLVKRDLHKGDPAYGPVDVVFAPDGSNRKSPMDVVHRPMRSMEYTPAGRVFALVEGINLHGKLIPLKGTPRKAHWLSNGKIVVACGFNGIAIVDPVTGAVRAMPDLNRHSTYGTAVFDVVPVDPAKPDDFLLAAGEIGIVAVHGADLSILSDCHELRWGHVNGLIRGPGSLLYAADESYGLRVLDVSDLKNMKLIGGVSLTDEPK